jgi:hypothetical protein
MKPHSYFEGVQQAGVPAGVQQDAGGALCLGCEQQAGVSAGLQHAAGGAFCLATNFTVIISPAARTMVINSNLFQRFPFF